MKLIKKLMLLATIGVFVFGMTTTVFAGTIYLDLDPNGGTFEGKAPGEHIVIETEFIDCFIDSYTLPEPTRDGYWPNGWDSEIVGIQDTSTPQFLHADWLKYYDIISGNNQTFYTESSDDLVIKIDGDINNVIEDAISLDIEKGDYNDRVASFNDDAYILTEGSTIITLKNSYLKTLLPGKYELYVPFYDGVENVSSFAHFTVVEGADPNAQEEDSTLPVEPTVPTDSDAQSTTPKTGDNSNMAVSVGIAMAAAAGIVTVAVFKKKTNA